VKTPSKLLLNVTSVACLLLAVRAPAQPLLAIDKNSIIATLHAEGAQIYECKPDTSRPAGQARALTWQFREPIATLMVGGQSVGRHYAGPSWDLVDGGAVKGRVVTSTPAATANDIPWLELEVLDVSEHRGEGILSKARIVRRINTKGGVAQGSCESAGHYLSVPYSADYVFLRKND
jgi:Protein of unknown function (DUF3455)